VVDAPEPPRFRNHLATVATTRHTAISPPEPEDSTASRRRNRPDGIQRGKAHGDWRSMAGLRHSDRNSFGSAQRGAPPSNRALLCLDQSQITRLNSISSSVASLATVWLDLKDYAAGAQTASDHSPRLENSSADLRGAHQSKSIAIVTSIGMPRVSRKVPRASLSWYDWTSVSMLYERVIVSNPTLSQII